MINLTGILEAQLGVQFQMGTFEIEIGSLNLTGPLEV